MCDSGLVRCSFLIDYLSRFRELVAGFLDRFLEMGVFATW